jgi:hypothetical protein
MKKLLPLAVLTLGLLAHAQEGPAPTQALITIDSKDAPQLTANDLQVEVNNHKLPLTSLAPVLPAGAQVAILIDDGMRVSFGREIGALRTFITSLPPQTEVFVGYMSNGRVDQKSYFTTDHVGAASKVRIPMGTPGISASPYFCLSDFVKRWPSEGFDGNASARKARFVLMLTNGVDPYNGSTSLMNQNSPYVETAQKDAQRAGVAVSSIYFGDSGFRGGRASFSGQSYLAQVAEATGGKAYFEGTGNPVSLDPFLDQFKQSLGETYVATFPAVGKDLVEFRVKTNIPKVKVRAPQQVHPGNAEAQ